MKSAKEMYEKTMNTELELLRISNFINGVADKQRYFFELDVNGWNVEKLETIINKLEELGYSAKTVIDECAKIVTSLVIDWSNPQEVSK